MRSSHRVSLLNGSQRPFDIYKIFYLYGCNPKSHFHCNKLHKNVTSDCNRTGGKYFNRKAGYILWEK